MQPSQPRLTIGCHHRRFQPKYVILGSRYLMIYTAPQEYSFINDTACAIESLASFALVLPSPLQYAGA